MTSKSFFYDPALLGTKRPDLISISRVLKSLTKSARSLERRRVSHIEEFASARVSKRNYSRNFYFRAVKYCVDFSLLIVSIFTGLYGSAMGYDWFGKPICLALTDAQMPSDSKLSQEHVYNFCYSFGHLQTSESGSEEEILNLDHLRLKFAFILISFTLNGMMKLLIDLESTQIVTITLKFLFFATIAFCGEEMIKYIFKVIRIDLAIFPTLPRKLFPNKYKCKIEFLKDAINFVDNKRESFDYNTNCFDPYNHIFEYIFRFIAASFHTISLISVIQLINQLFDPVLNCIIPF
ncbi:MAG: hypothetical protein MHMPM18_001557 [Marteilia pararefringens]